MISMYKSIMKMDLENLKEGVGFGRDLNILCVYQKVDKIKFSRGLNAYESEKCQWMFAYFVKLLFQKHNQ